MDGSTVDGVAADGARDTAGGVDGNRDAVADGARPDGASSDANTDGRPADGATGDGAGGRSDGAGDGINTGEVGVRLPRAYLSGGGCQCDVAPTSPGVGFGLSILFALLGMRRRRR